MSDRTNNLDEPTRRCDNPRCRRLLTRADERAGRCPMCLAILLTLAPAEAFQVAFIEREGPPDAI